MSAAYKVALVIHLVALVACWGPLLVYPVMLRTGQHAEVARLHGQVTLPGGFLLAVSGAGLIGLSRHAWSFDQSWVGVGLLTWMVLVAVQLALVRPAVARGDGHWVTATIGASHGLLLVAVSVMVFKPGL